MAILPSLTWSALSASPHVSFPHPAKVVGLDFNLAPWDGAGMSLDFLDSTCPALPHPILALSRIDNIDKG